MNMMHNYLPQDTMSLWWHGRGPTPPQLIGQLLLVDGNRKVGLEYCADWLSSGFALSTDLPLLQGVQLPSEHDMAVGAVNDARPDRWGERVIRDLYRPPRLSVLDHLYFAGSHRVGSLGVSLAADSFRPASAAALPRVASLAGMQRAITAFKAGEKLSEQQQHLVEPGASLGGARPKSLIELDGAQWIVKFSDGEDFDNELVEHATMGLASACGLHVAQTRALPLTRGHAIAVKRFDRAGSQRFHVACPRLAIGLSRARTDSGADRPP